MATIKTKFRPATDSHQPGKIYYQVIHKRQVRRVTSRITLHPNEWDSAACAPKIPAGPRGSTVKTAAATIAHDLKLLRQAVADLDAKGHEYTADDIVNAFAADKSSPSFLDFMQQEISRKTALGKDGTAQNYQAAFNSFCQFLGDANPQADEVNSELMEEYQAWLTAKDISNNSISFYMRILRCVYNHAVKRGLTPDRKPFDDVYTGVDKTRKRAISASDIKKIKDLDLKANSNLERARDLFMLSFYCMGISFVDLAMLKRSDLSQGRLTYKRAKTAQTISMAVNPKMSSMFAKYSSDKDSPFLLNIVKAADGDVRRQYQNELNLVNRHLKKVGALAALDTTLTTYVSRHSWASIARSKNIKISTISDALGHENEATTQIYLASLDTGHVDRANEIILKGL